MLNTRVPERTQTGSGTRRQVRNHLHPPNYEGDRGYFPRMHSAPRLFAKTHVFPPLVDVHNRLDLFVLRRPLGQLMSTMLMNHQAHRKVHVHMEKC